jgi:glycosyltransferase involved in cell wall biosynthesis
MVADDFVCGGAFMVGVRLARGLARAYRVAFACDVSSVNRAVRQELATVGVEVIRLFAHAGDTRRARYDRGGACALLQRATPDKILFVDSSPRSNIVIKDAAHEAGVPYVSIINFIDKETPAPLKIFDADVERTANAAAAVVFVSAAARAEFEAIFPGATAPRLVIGNGVPDIFFEPVVPQSRRALRRELSLDDDDVMLLLAGRLEPRKGQHLALSALAALGSRAGPRLRLFIAGFGELAEIQALAEGIRQLNLQREVLYLGVRDDLPMLIDACDIVLMPSEQEADPLVAKEAMARGRPVIASDLPGVREQGHPGEMLIPAPGEASERTVEALATAIDALRRDPVRRTEIGRSLRAVAEQRFTMPRMIGAYRDILDALPARRRIRPAPWLTLGRWLTWPQEAAGLFKDGWSEVEDDGIWSVGARSRIAFTLPWPARKVTISLRVWTFAAPGRERRFEVFANTRRVATWIFSDQNEVVREISVSMPAARRLVVLRFCHADTSSPYQLGLNQDTRPLGFFVFALRLDSGDSLPRRLALRWRG